MLKYLFWTIVVAAILITAFIMIRRQVFKHRNAEEISSYKNESYKNNLGKVLVVYYSFTGNTKEIAMNIKEKTNADLYEIELAEPYPNGAKLHMEVREQNKTGEFPKIKPIDVDISDYDLVIVGSPVWWYTLSTPVSSFLNQTDFKGKNVSLYVTHAGEPGKSFSAFEEKAKNTNIKKGEAFFKVLKEDKKLLKGKVSHWLNSL